MMPSIAITRFAVGHALSKKMLFQAVPGAKLSKQVVIEKAADVFHFG